MPGCVVCLHTTDVHGWSCVAAYRRAALVIATSPSTAMKFEKWRSSQRACGATCILSPAEKITEPSSEFAHLRMSGLGNLSSTWESPRTREVALLSLVLVAGFVWPAASPFSTGCGALHAAARVSLACVVVFARFSLPGAVSGLTADTMVPCVYGGTGMGM